MGAIKNNIQEERTFTTSFIDGDGSSIKLEANITFRNGYREFTVSGRVKGGSCAQMLDSINCEGIKNSEAVSRVVELWENHHLKEVGVEVEAEIEALFKKIDESGNTYEVDSEDKKVVALAKHLNLHNCDSIEGSGNHYSAGEGSFIVCKGEDEADEQALECIEQLYDDMGMELFSKATQEQLLHELVDGSWFDEALRESNEVYAQDIELEGDDKFVNRLVRECYESGILNDSHFEEDENEGILYHKLNDQGQSINLVNELADHLSDDDEDSVQQFIDNFGEEYFKEVVSEKGLIDEYKLKEFLMDGVHSDGRGYTLNGYDGVEHEVEVDGETYYIYES